MSKPTDSRTGAAASGAAQLPLPGSPPAETTLEGILEDTVFANEDNGWSVLKLSVAGRRELVTVVGNVLGVQPGESLHFTGKWVMDRRYGEQFRAESFRTVRPATVTGIERYLASGLIQGIGKKMAQRLVAAFGVETLEVIEHHPERLRRVPGIGRKRLATILEAWREQRHIQEVMVFLQAHGIATAHAIRIYKTYGDEAIDRVQEDPFRLASEVFGIGFKTADQIAERLGMPHDSPRRLEAGALYLLSQASTRGHLFLPQDQLLTDAAELLGVPAAAIEVAVEALVRAGELIAEERPGWPAGQRALYGKFLYHAEVALAARLSHLLATSASGPDIDVERALAWFEEREGISLAQQQRQAIGQGLSRKVLVITGGPGTGKTTLVRGIVEILAAKGATMLLAAPTGRAARRLSEATGQEARTVHRLLEFDPRQMTFTRGADRPLEADLVIVDEASMLDVALASNLARAVPDAGRLILVGDADQLPSVGPGRVLADLIDSGQLPVVRLTEIFRQAARSRIVVNAHRINRGEAPLLDEDADSDFFFIERQEPEEVLDTLVYLVSERIPKSFHFDPVSDIQLLSPMNRGPLGVANLNRVLQQRLNPSGSSFERGGRSLRQGDKVMQVRNNYELDVFNGDLGRILELDAEEHRLSVDFDGRRVSYSFNELDELVTAYACTIHKAQGSEYPCVVAPIHGQHYHMLQRNLLYTAVTRARKLVVLVGQRRALAAAVRQQDSRRRFTRLAERLAEVVEG